MRFIFVDKIIEIEKESQIFGSKNLTMSEDYFEHHFPFFPVMPGVLMLEVMIELSRWLVLYSTDFKFFSFLARLHRGKFRKSAQPGDTLHAQVEWFKKTEQGILFTGKIFLEEKMIAEAKFETKLIEVESNQDRELLIRNYQFLTTKLQDRIKK